MPAGWCSGSLTGVAARGVVQISAMLEWPSGDWVPRHLQGIPVPDRQQNLFAGRLSGLVRGANCRDSWSMSSNDDRKPNERFLRISF